MSHDPDITVLVVDDQDLVRGGLAAMLSAAGITVVGEASSGPEAVDQATRLRPDVVLMDVQMPAGDGITATRRIAAMTAPPRVLILTTFDLDEYVFDALKAGASGFLLKTTPRDELAQAVRTVAAGTTLLAPTVTSRLIETFVTRPVRATDGVPPQLAALSEREIDVLRQIARGRSNGEIAADLFLSEATVKTYVSRMFTKLDLRDRVQAVVLAYETGLVEPGGG